MGIIFAHRGVHQIYPENSIASFKEAISLGALGIETDVHLSKDQVPVIMHDESLKRMTGDKRYLKDLTLSQLKELRLKGTNQSIPTLKELLIFLNQENFQGVLNLEIKTDQIHYPHIEAITVDLVNQYASNYQVIFSSFYAQSLIKLHQLTNFECAYLFRQNDKVARQLYNMGIVQSFHPKYAYTLKDTSVPLRAWTVNSVSQMEICFLLDIAGIFTDNLELAFRVQKNLAHKKN